MCKHILLLTLIFALYTNIVSTLPIGDDTTDDLVVSTTSGLVRGTYGKPTVGQNRTVYWFRRIPFAEPPVGELRFEPPVPKKNWEEIYDATKESPECFQKSPGFTLVEELLPWRGSEDCLYLQIFTTSLPRHQKPKLPVMVFIHGGAFIGGSANFSEYSPDYLLDEDVIVAAIHYRLGIFGFLTTGDLVVPGNNGLKDQVLGLRWIKDNIEAFGGDSDNITIFGQSAGSASVSYIVQSKLAKGLFNRAIMQSGGSLCLWSHFREGAKFFREVADSLGVSTNDSTVMVEGLKSIDAETIQQTLASSYINLLVTNNPRNGLILGPVMEPDHEGAIFSERSYDVLERGDFNHVPIIVGHTSLEAYLSELSRPLRFWLASYDIKNSKLVPVNLNVQNETLLREIGMTIKTEYFGNTPISLSNREFMEYVSDDQFERPIQEAVRLYSSKVPVYYYRFSYEGSLGGVTNRTFRGVGHSEDLRYLFDYKNSVVEQDYLTRERIVRMWTNFAKTGNPTPEEDPVLGNVTWTANIGDSEDLYCLDIDEDLKVINNPNKSRMRFWKAIYQKYSIPSLDTY